MLYEVITSTRVIKFNEFIFDGPNYTSKAYGEISFMDNNMFTWKNRENLITKQLITANAGEEGNVQFKNFLGENLKSKYDGIITFDFGDRQELNFFRNNFV